MGIQVYNSLTNRKEAFEPVNPPKVGIYLCGPTVYKPSHIGHAVGPVIFDAIKRYLVHRGYEVTWVVNITDVDDKLIDESARQGLTVPALAEEVTQNYLDAMHALQVTGIDRFPKASEHIGDIVDICQRLIAKNAAYVSGGDVYFDVTADEDYGKLSNRSLEDQTGQRALASGEKRHPSDFALWKAAKPEEPDEVKFDSPWGPGRPGWHIECSAMAMKILGETFDIHGGGLDLIFPHHENEVAQSETCTDKPFSKYWLHHGLTRFNTKKVSKSDPEMQAALQSMTLSNLLTEYSGELLRYFILSTQYRRPIEYSTDELASKRKGLNTFYRVFDRVRTIIGQSVYDDVSADAALPPWVDENAAETPVATLAADLREAHKRFHEAMDEDFNTAGAIAALFELANALNRFVEHRKLESEPSDADARRLRTAAHTLVGLGRIIGLFIEPPAASGASDEKVGKVMETLIAVRSACRNGKQFELADALRDGLTPVGVTLEDKPDGTTWQASKTIDAELLDRLVNLLINVRQQARQSKQFQLADLVRDELSNAGIILEDKPTGTTWSAA